MLPKNNPQILGICFMCKTKQTFTLKPLNDGREHFVCPKCNAANSGMRLTKDQEAGKAWRVN